VANEVAVVAPLLEAVHLAVQFGGLRAVDDVSFHVSEAEIVGLIGPNGAGKTTIFNCISGVIRPTSGTIRIRGEAVGPLVPEQACRLGILRTFQNVRLFGELSLRDNIMMGAFRAGSCSMVGAMLRTAKHGRLELLARERAEYWMRRLNLAGFADVPATALPLGLQRVAEVARAMAAEPSLVLLDEPGAGLNAVEKQRLSVILREVSAETRCALLVVDHDMALVMGLVQRLVVVDFGKRIATGTPDEVVRDPAVIEAYLGAD
jgi:branched-chain amino acid transport system ATP-binding protein